jgi:hypothetical protein
MANEIKPPGLMLPVLIPSSKLDLVKAQEKFREFWNHVIVCPICGTSGWDFGPDLVQLAHFSDVGESLASNKPFKTYPAVVVICRNCGYMMLFNASKLGLANG